MTHVDQLLEEYLRVINDKDDQIHKLIKVAEEHRSAHKKREDTLKSKLARLRSEAAESEKTIAELSGRAAEDDISMNKLVNANELLKKDLNELEGKLHVSESNRNDLEHSLRSGELRSSEERAALAEHAARETEARERLQAQTEENERAIKALQDQTEELEKKLKGSEEARAAATDSMTALRHRLEQVVPASQYEQRLKEIEDLTRDHAARTLEMQRRLHNSEDEAKKLAQSLNFSQQRMTEAIAEREASDALADEAKQTLKMAKQDHAHQTDLLQREAQQWKQAANKAADQVTDMERQMALKDEQLARGKEALHEARILLEREKGTAEKAEEVVRAQSRSVTEQTKQLQEEVARLQRQLSMKETALQDAQEALGGLREASLRTASDLRDQVGQMTTSAAARKDECDRLQCELKQVKHELHEAQERLNSERTSLRGRAEELQVASQRAQEQLRAKEEEVRRADLLHEKALQEMHHQHTRALEELRHSKDAEIQDFVSRLERLRSELSENFGGSKGLARELQLSAEMHRRLQEEIARAQSGVVQRDDVILGLKNEVATLQGKVLHQEQRQKNRDDEEKELRQQAQDAKHNLQRAERELEDKERRILAMQEQHVKLQADLQAQEHVHTTTRGQLAESKEAEQAVRREVQALTAAAEKQQHRAEQLDGQLQEAKQAVLELKTELGSLKGTVKAQEAEERRLRAELETCNTDMRRATQHAEEVEQLAKKTSEEMHAGLTSRDATIASLQADLAAVVPKMNEERSKHLVLQEKLQHIKELEGVHAANAQERIDALETSVRDYQSEIESLSSDKASLVSKMQELQEQIKVQHSVLEAKERKFQHGKEELQKALEVLQKERDEVKEVEERLGTEMSAAGEIRERYKKERAKMEVLAKQLEDKATEAARAEKESRQREASLMEDLASAEAALRDTQSDYQNRLADMKAMYEQRWVGQENAYREAMEIAAGAEEKYSALHATSRAAQEEATANRQTVRSLQRMLTQCAEDHLTQFAAEALRMKSELISLVVEAHRAAVSHAGRGVVDGWRCAQTAIHHVESRVRDAQADVNRQLRDVEHAHRAELERVERACDDKIDSLVAQHSVELQQAKKAVAEQASQTRREKDAVSRLAQEHDDSLHAMKVEMQCMRSDVEHHAKQAETFREQRDAAEGRYNELQRTSVEEKRKVRGEYDTVKRQLDDRVVELRHAEEELRELRAEATAIQQVLAEKDAQLQRERDRARADTEQLAKAVAERDNAKAQLNDLQRDADGARMMVAACTRDGRDAIERANTGLREAQSRADALHAELTNTQVDKRRLERHVEAAEHKMEAMSAELQLLRRQEAEVVGQMQARKAEISALRERCANLESLKNISDASLAETQARERGLLEKLEDLRNSQQLMQICFDKQQEQLEVGRRLRAHRTA